MAECEVECKKSLREEERAAAARARETPAVVRIGPPDRPLVAYFWIPGILLGVVTMGAGAQRLRRRRQEEAWATILGDLDAEARLAAQQKARELHPTITAALQAVRSKDHAFSWVLFEDFVHALYVEAQTRRGGGQLHLLEPYLTSAALSVLGGYRADSVTTVIVGSMHTEEVLAPSNRSIVVKIGFDANFTETTEGKAQSYYVHERWTLSRPADLLSRPPARSRTIDCPGCAAVLDKLVGQKCRYCGAPSAPGTRDWRVDSVEIVRREARGPQLTGTTEEVGTGLPTLVAPDVKSSYAALSKRDPAFLWSALQARVALVFATFHQAWSAQELAPMRPFMSDTLFDTQQYWIEAYKTQRLRNLTEGAEILTVALSRIVRDEYFDALTVRVFATCLDYTLDASDKLVGGSRKLPRQYTEYWTFIRSVEARGAASSEPTCPNCGADIEQINMTGECGSCRVQVTAGQFDWVLSRIEQDESYRL